MFRKNEAVESVTAYTSYRSDDGNYRGSSPEVVDSKPVRVLYRLLVIALVVIALGLIAQFVLTPCWKVTLRGGIAECRANFVKDLSEPGYEGYYMFDLGYEDTGYKSFRPNGFSLYNILRYDSDVDDPLVRHIAVKDVTVKYLDATVTVSSEAPLPGVYSLYDVLSMWLRQDQAALKPGGISIFTDHETEGGGTG